MSDKLTQLRWKRLEYKLFYYEPEAIHNDWREELSISDQEYDRLESVLLDAGIDLPVGFPDTPAGRLVRSKLRKSKKDLEKQKGQLEEMLKRRNIEIPKNKGGKND